MRPFATLTLTLALLLPAVGCDLESASLFDRAADASSDRTDAPDHRGPPVPPPVMLAHLAMEIGDLHEDPAMVEALEMLEAGHQEARAAQDALHVALAAAVTEGVVSTDAVTTELAAIEAAARVEAEALTFTLNAAHDLLDAEEREEAVDALLDAPPPGEERGAPEGDRPPPGAPEGDRPPPGAPEGDAGPSGDMPRPPGDPMDRLLGALALDEDQHEALRATLGEPEPREPAELPDLESFVDEDFDAEALGLADLHVEHSLERATRLVELLGALVPLLDEDQLATLVEQLGSP